MAMNARAARPLLIYLLLVGLPLVGLLGVLRAGQGLHAPPTVQGTWRTIAAGTGPGARTAFLPMSRGEHPAQVEVQQSGTYLSVAIGQLRLSGRLRGDSLVAHAHSPAASGGAEACGGARQMELHAALDRSAEPHRLTAVLSEPGRPACPQVQWTAEHQARATAGGGKGAH
jgi:hypothetical protein